MVRTTKIRSQNDDRTRRLQKAIANRELTNAVTVLNESGYTDPLTIGFILASAQKGGSNDA